MSHAPAMRVTWLLEAVRSGDPGATDELMKLVYDELRAIAGRKMAAVRSGDTLQATALVHEAYLRLFNRDDIPWEDRAHFFFSAARAMRDILVEEARKDASLKRGGGRRRFTLDEAIVAAEPADEDVLALDEALRRLDASDERSAAVIKLRYFAGLTIEQTARVMGVSAPTVKRYWHYARAWLRSQIVGEVEASGGD